MDPRYQPELEKTGRFVRGRIVGIHFRVDADRVAHASRLCVINVNRDGHYLNGRGPGFELDGLETYDEATGLLHTSDRGAVEGVLTIGMVRQGESPDAALERLAPDVVPDVPALWRQLVANETARQAKLHESIRVGGRRLLGGLLDPDAVSFDDGSRGFGGT